MSTVGHGKLTTEDTGAKIIERLRAALRSDGDFPVRARVVTELRTLANSPNTKVDQISELILREPSLGTRVLHLVNSAFYQRTVPIMTVKQSVLQLGMRSLSDLCAGFVLMQKFVPAAQRGGIFGDSVKRTILNALISNKLASLSKQEAVSERGYLAGTFFNLGFLLLAFYFPQVYEAAVRRSRARGYSTTRSIAEILGVGPAELSIAIVEALKIPDFYRDVLVESHKPRPERKGAGAVLALAEAVAVGGRLSDAIVEGRTREDLEKVIIEICASNIFSLVQIVSVLDELPAMFEKHCELIELSFLTLPDFLKDFGQNAFRPEEERGESDPSSQMKLFARYVADIRASIEGGDPLSNVLILSMEAIERGLGFERVVLLYADSDAEHLMGRLAVGDALPCEVRDIYREIVEGSENVVMKAFLKGRMQIFGDPLFDDAFPFVAIPVGAPERAKGVLYADRVSTPDARPIDDATQASFALLTELIDQSVAAWE